MNSTKSETTAAIIAEYNPFHNGHAYHIAQTRALTGAKNIVVIMSGNFVQRGDCAICDKFSRALMALTGGADLVLELPLPFACAAAETFAAGGVGIADALGCVDYLSFGTECGDVGQLAAAADAVSDSAIKPLLDKYLAEGKPFAAARTEAVREAYGDDTAALLCLPLPSNTSAHSTAYIRTFSRSGFSARACRMILPIRRGISRRPPPFAVCCRTVSRTMPPAFCPPRRARFCVKLRRRAAHLPTLPAANARFSPACAV